jgi:chromosome partitioning protein
MVIAFVNHKGGVGKTTCALNIGAGLARVGKKVLLIDADAQANLTISAGLSKNETPSLYDILKKQSSIYDAITSIESIGLSVIPATLALKDLPDELGQKFDRERLIEKQLRDVRNEFDYILIDCAPSLDLMTKNALVAADAAMIPVKTDYLTLQGLDTIAHLIEEIRVEEVNPRLHILGVLPTMFDAREVICKEAVSQIHHRFSHEAFRTPIRENVSIKEAPTSGKSIFEYAPKSHGASDFRDVCSELLERVA